MNNLLERSGVEDIRLFLSGLRCGFTTKLELAALGLCAHYASSPLTTGYRMYQVFRANKVRSMDELRSLDSSWPFEKIMKANIAEGNAFAARLRAMHGPYVLSPMPLKVAGWGQGHYMALWERVIVEHMHVVDFNRLWFYSNGCVEEFLIGLNEGLHLKDHQGKTIKHRQGRDKVARAIENLERWHMDASKLTDLYRRIALS